MRRRQSNTFLRSFIVTLAIFASILLLIWFVLIPQFRQLPFFSNRDIVPFHEHFALDPSVMTLVFDGQLLRDGTPPMVEYRGGLSFVYLPASFLQMYIDPFLFWDDSAGVFFASTRFEMLEFMPNMSTFLINDRPYTTETPIRRVDGEVFVNIEMVEGLYSLIVDYVPEYNMVVVSSANQTTATVAASSANVRYRADSRAQIVTQLQLDDEVVINPGGNIPITNTFLPNAEFSTFVPYPPIIPQEEEDFVRVRTPQGFLGYVLREELSNHTVNNRFDISGRPTILPTWINNMEQHPPNWSGGKINMVWEVVYHPDANDIHMRTPFHSSLTVVSPQWFRFNGDDLRLDSVASRAYVDWAHDQGVYVWPLVFDVNQREARAILMNREARQTVIDQIVTFVSWYNLDGINIDIEHLFAEEEGPYKIQFLRELAIPMREMGVVLSADVKVPMEWSRFYRRYLIGLTVDFVVVMTYDEHWNTSPVSGPVASLPWVQNGIANMLMEVPREKLIMGLPFYNRIWREVVLDDGPPTTSNRGMGATVEFFEERGVVWEWDSTIASYYGEVGAVEDGQAVLYRVWRECARSITMKLQVHVVNDLAGIASWRRGFESPDIWEILGRYFP